jgi:hypothetical protein
MNAQRLVLCLALLASSVGFAQAPDRAAPPAPSLSPPPLVPAPSAPPLVPVPEEPAAPEVPEAPVPEGEIIPRSDLELLPGSPRFAPGRVALEAVGGVVGGVGLGLGAVFGIAGLFAISVGCDEACAVVASLLALPAIAIGIPLGVSLAGGLMEGQGRFLPALGGMFAGVGATLLVGASNNEAVTTLAALTLPVAGAVIGYELSHSVGSRTLEEDEGSRGGYARSSFQVVPVLGVTARGGFLGGLSGRF